MPKKTMVVDPEKIKWEPVEQFPKGAWAKVLRLDEETGERVLLAKYDKGLQAPKHTHPSDENSIVLEGKAVDEKGNEVKKGMYLFIPAGVEHGPINVLEDCLLFIHFSGRR